jgi:hypothetical protein
VEFYSKLELKENHARRSERHPVGVGVLKAL